MTERFRNPVIKYTTDTLKTLPGSKLRFFQNGTSTPKTVYADKNKVTSLGSVVTADSAGIFVPIFLDGTYRVSLENAAGVIQTGWPVDNVGGEDTQGQFDDYSAVTSYSIGELVTGSDGNRYESTANSNLNNDPTVLANRTGYWKQIFITGEYVSTEAYGVGDYISYDGGLYKCVQAATGQNPNTSHAYWQRMHNIPHWGSTSTYRHYDLAIDSNGVVQVSQQNSNINHNPVGDTAYTWWKPLFRVVLEANPQLIKVNTLSGGGNLLAEWNNELTDSSTYALPPANSVPANTVLYAGKTDQYKAQTPIVERSGSDNIRYGGGTDTQLRFSALYALTLRFKSNGSNEWSI